MKAKTSIYNLLVGVLCQAVILALGLVIPRLYILNFGSEVNGIMTTINDIFVYISLLEAGIGAATVQALYKPIVQKNRQRINEILSATSVYYRRTGVMYFVALVVFAAVFPFVVKSGIGTVRIMLLVFFTGIGNVINFLFQGKYRQLLLAEGKVYITTAISSAANVLASVSKVFLILAGFDIVAVQFVYFILSLMQMAFFEIYIRVRYKWIDLSVQPDFSAISQKNSVLVHQISGLVFRNTDVLLLTIVCGAKIASVYIIYNIIFNVMEGFINVVNDSLNAAMGQEYHRDIKSYARLFNYYELGYFALAFIACTTIYFLIMPFIKLYTAGVNDVNYIVNGLPLMFVIMKFFSWGRTPCAFTITYAGRFRDTRTKAILEAVINLAASLLLIKPLGIYGVVAGSIAAFVYSAAYSVWYANTKLVDLNAKRTIGRWVLFVSGFAAAAVFEHFVPVRAESYAQLVLAAFVVGAASTVYYSLLSVVFNHAACVGLVRTGIRFAKEKIGKK